jgi:hypothetical protein
MHHPVLCIAFIPITVELISCEYRPVLLVSVCLCFEPALSLEDILLVLLDIAKAFDWDNWLLAGRLFAIC